MSNATTIVNATVTGGSAGSIALSASPTTLTAAAGAAAVTSTITITRTAPFTGAVALAVTGAPAGVTASVSPASAAGTTATLSVSSTAAAVNGTYPLTVTGSGTGVSNATTIVNATVTGGGGGGGSITAAFCTADAPIWVAAQDGNGAWTRVLPTTVGGSTYQFTFASGRGGVARVDTIGTSTDLSVVYGTVAEFTSYAASANFGGCGAKTVNGSVANVAVTEAANVSLGFSPTIVIPALSTSFQLTNVADGPQDLVGVRADATTFAANKVILRRALNPANNSTLPVLDFNAEGFAPVSPNVTVTDLGTDEARITALFTGVRGSAFGLLSLITSYTAASGAVPYGAIPLAQLNANEFQQLSALASAPGSSTSDRTAAVYFRSPVNQTLALGPVLSTPTVTKLVTAPNARPRVQLAGQAEYNRLFQALYDQSGNTVGERQCNGPVLRRCARHLGRHPPGSFCRRRMELGMGAAGWGPDHLGRVGVGRRHCVPRCHDCRWEHIA